MRKSKKIRQPKRAVFSFVVDGKCEFWYLQLLQRYEKVTINLEPKLPQKKLLSVQFAQVEELAEESEKVFWIVDFDTILKETQEAKRGRKTPLQEFQKLYNKVGENEKIIIIVNNPCLEYWFLLHFEQTSKHFPTYEELEKSVKKHLTDYEKTERYYKNSRQNIYQRLKPYLPTAITNAENLGEFTFDNIRTGMTEMRKIFNSLGIGSR
ncbi:MAG: RloB family protein [Prevotellaceae bacterium]|jgi:hypothetical protein|nr:RloB family protein [Prevotellaceae bacterium]